MVGRARFAWLAGLFVAALLGGCEEKKLSSTPVAEEVRPRSSPIEYVGLTVERNVTLDEFRALASSIFGETAMRGQRAQNLELQSGVFLSVAEDPRTAEQVILTLDMNATTAAGATERRTVLRVPVSFQYGKLFIDTVDAAMRNADALHATAPGDTRPFDLEYRVASVNGGALVMRLVWKAGVATLRFETQEPGKSLEPGLVNTRAFSGEPYETIAGTVFFELSRDEFAFFSNRAYGVTSGAAQNFKDFRLVPHNWLRITVTPRLADKLVDVGFEVVKPDGSRVAFAKAPASFAAGDQFQQNVFRMMDNMTAQERTRAGSSNAWRSQFHYDDPEGGGVVKVIASGERGVFSIAYAVESPTHRLRDVDFVPYTAKITVPSMVTSPNTTCETVGSTTAVRGRFKIKFDASSTVRMSRSLDGPLRGNIWISVFHAADVTIVGPNEGAVAVADLQFQNVDLTDRANLMEYVTDLDLSAGQYQILGFIDIDGNAGTEGEPDVNDPVTLPIGAYTMGCAVQPVTVEFALPLPADR